MTRNATKWTTGILGTASLAGGLTIAPETLDSVMTVLGALLLWVTGYLQPSDGPPASARDMARRAGASIVLASLLAGCGGVQAPAHVATVVEITDEVDVSTGWMLCWRRLCVRADAGVLISPDGTTVCLELPDFDLLHCEVIRE